MKKDDDGCSPQFQSKHMFAFVAHFDKSIQLEWHYNETHHGKDPTDGVSGTIKRVVFGLVKSNHDKHNGRICNKDFKGCAVHSINLPFPRL